jgi:hypothetical protein
MGTHFPRVEAGSNTSTVTLQVVGGDEKGSLKTETVKYGLKSQGTRIRERLRWQGPAAHTKDRPVLSSDLTLTLELTSLEFRGSRVIEDEITRRLHSDLKR